MTQHGDPRVLHIKKYPNRRYYDALNSRHVTLKEIHDAIVSGQDVVITDSRTGDDITNLVLTQILLEQDQPKFDIFPTALFHLMIRSNRQMLRNWVERVFGPFMGLLATSQKQFDAYLRQAMGGTLPTPFDWAKGFVPGTDPSAPASGQPGADDWSPREAGRSPSDTPSDEAIAEMRRQLTELTRRIEELSSDREQQPKEGL